MHVCCVLTDAVLIFRGFRTVLGSCGAADGCHTQLLTPFGKHKEDYTDKNSNCSLLLLAITDTRRICYFVGGIPGSQGDSLWFWFRSWYEAMLDEDVSVRPLAAREFILGDAGFALTALLVRTDPCQWGGGEGIMAYSGVYAAIATWAWGWCQEGGGGE